jgi:LytR cell envelope-related transcriptional attenuator
VQHAQPFDRPFPWRAAALAACALALAELAALLALAGIRLVHVHHPVGTSPERTRPVPGTGHGPNGRAIALRARSKVSVVVLNGNGVQHAAGNEATRLLGLGYRRADATDASTRYASSLVLFRPGWEREARRLARDAGIRTVTPLDGRLPGAGGGHQLVVILGSN